MAVGRNIALDLTMHALKGKKLLTVLSVFLKTFSTLNMYVSVAQVCACVCMYVCVPESACLHLYLRAFYGGDAGGTGRD